MKILPEVFRAKEGILRNVLYNLAGNVIPLIAAAFTIPVLIRGYGKEEFGILSLAWVVVGYFSLADLGLSRALTKFVAELIGQDKRQELSELIWTALAAMAILGVLAAVLVALLTPLLVNSILKIETTSARDVKLAFYLLSLGIPFTIVSAGLRGILEALMRFDLANYVRSALGILNFIGPALVLPFSANILAAIVILVASRVVSLFVYVMMCFRLLPEMASWKSPKKYHFKPLIKFGGWITISNLVSPIMTNFDRFFLAGLVSVSALAYYSAPWEMVVRLLIIPSSIAAVLYPIFSQRRGCGISVPRVFFSRSLKYVFFAMSPLCLFLVIAAKPVLGVWLGPDYASNSYRIMQVMSIAVFVNGLAAIPFSLIQGVGRPDITAKFHLLELVLYIPFLWIMIKTGGILGAAIAWLARVTLDLSLLMAFSYRKVLPQLLTSKPNDFAEGAANPAHTYQADFK